MDPVLRREVESLIKAQEQEDSSFMEQPAIQSSALKAGTKLGTYEIITLLGAGGMGEVYKARDSKLGRDVALKLLPTAVMNDTERFLRLQREARTLAALNHPNIGVIYGLEESGGFHFLVLELIAGESLAERLERGPLAMDQALGVCRQIAEALEVAHE